MGGAFNRARPGRRSVTNFAQGKQSVFPPGSTAHLVTLECNHAFQVPGLGKEVKRLNGGN
jgi:hypothetical protein